MKKFEKAFLGNTKNASKREILNPTVLDFENANGKLTAKSSDLIEIENRSTGYTFFFYLQKFEADGQVVIYSGKPFFKELIPNDEKEFENWQRQREKTYYGSPQHFYQSLVKNRLSIDGFKVYNATLQSNNQFVINGKPKVQELILDSKNSQEKILNFNDFLKVVYTKEKGQLVAKDASFRWSATKLGHAQERDAISQESPIR